MSTLGNYNKYSKIAITNIFEAWKHGQIVAKELSRAQLYSTHVIVDSWEETTFLFSHNKGQSVEGWQVIGQ